MTVMNNLIINFNLVVQVAGNRRGVFVELSKLALMFLPNPAWTAISF